jgi:hypothetical protein
VAELAIVALGSIWFRNDCRSRAPRKLVEHRTAEQRSIGNKRACVHGSVCGSAVSTTVRNGHEPRLRPEARSRDRTASVTLAAA